MLAERKRLEEQIISIQNQLETLPEGKIICARNGTRYKWYLSNESQKIYLPKKKRRLAEQLAKKKYLSSLLSDLRQEQRAIDFYLRHHEKSPSKTMKMLTDMPEYQELLSSHFKPLLFELNEWMIAPYISNPKRPEQLIHKTLSGKMVRSKSEALIASVLYTHKIPFRYECILVLGKNVLYPDFTIRHPHTGKIIYWEHFGLMDNQVYSNNACSKLQLYTSHNIIPTIQLITTYETKENPLNTETIERIVTEYFV